MGKLKIGVIGGSGLETLDIFENPTQREVDTPFGKPSSPIVSGKINGIEVMFISRFGFKHEIPPTQVNNKANIFALKYEGCRYIIATTAVGSLREDIKRGDFVVVDDFIDFTCRRDLTFFEKFEFGAMHTLMVNPFSDELRKKLIESCSELKIPVCKKGTIITIEGPRFSTRAESNLFRQWGADIINMATSPEAILANEAEIPFATIAAVTDYDCWKEDEESVTWEMIKQIMKDNTEKLKQILLKTIDSFSREEEIKKLKEKVRSVPNFPMQGIIFRDITTLLKDKEALKKLIDILYDRYKDFQIDAVAGIESRGFVLAGMLAGRLGTGLVLIRKPGKLPAETISESYNLKYGVDSVEIHKDAISPNQKILLVDDLIATGGTALASCSLIEKLQGEVVECCFAMELPELKGREKLAKYPFFSVMKFNESE
ncbi:S-methyl-5'-thioadenosine phosphorylase [uncultured archaeon]|nr:S-methyl-5'-thioadenosine phosphorylase [uncultured archaeon]